MSRESDEHRTRQTVRHASNTARGYFSTLFDFSFSRFITVQMFPVLYGVILLSTVIGIGYFTAEAFLSSMWRGLFYLLVAGPVAFITIATVTRALMEFYIVVFRIAENMDEIREITERFSGLSQSVESMQNLTKRLPFWGATATRQPEEPDPATKAKRKKEATWY